MTLDLYRCGGVKKNYQWGRVCFSSQGGGGGPLWFELIEKPTDPPSWKKERGGHNPEQKGGKNAKLLK